jgi:hypothetical protein
MIEAAQKEAAQRGVEHIKWMIGSAEDLVAPPAAFELITIGEAFHRLDQELVTRQMLHWLKPGCGLAILGCHGVSSGQEPWQRIIADVVRRWTGRDSSDGNVSVQPGPDSGADHDELVLRTRGFIDLASYRFFEPRAWTVETIIGNLYSTSFCSRKVLGGNSEAFESDLTAALLAHDASGIYHEDMRFGYTFARRLPDSE